MNLKDIDKLELLEWLDDYLAQRIRRLNREMPKILSETIKKDCVDIINIYEETRVWIQIKRIELAQRVLKA